jgi:Hint domain
MTHNPTDLNVKARRTRRNIIKMGAIVVPATLGSVHSAAAGSSEICIFGICIPIPITPPGSGNRSGNCFLNGTRIRTAEGERRVEDLAIGELLPTMFGGLRPIQWIGHYSIKKTDPSKPWPEDARPVRIARSALAPNVPEADLYVSQAHGVFIDDVLASACYLVNGTTVTLYDASEWDELQFFHIKLERHDVIYAEGAPVESLLDVDEGAVNFADYFRQYGVPTAPELPCLPFLSNWRRRGLKSRLGAVLSWNDRQRRIEAIRKRLKQRAIALSQELEPSL